MSIFKKVLVILSVVACCGFISTAVPYSAEAFTVDISWTASGDNPNMIQGYEVWYGNESRNYTSKVFVPQGTTITSIDSLTDGDMYYFSVKTIGWNGLDSDFTNEVRTDGSTIPGGTQPSPPGGCYIESVY